MKTLFNNGNSFFSSGEGDARNVKKLTLKELQEKVIKKCNGDHGRYKNRETAANVNNVNGKINN